MEDSCSLNFTKSKTAPWAFFILLKVSTPPWMFSTFLKLYKWYQISKSTTFYILAGTPPSPAVLWFGNVGRREPKQKKRKKSWSSSEADTALHKKWSFPLRVSSVNRTKSAVSKSLMENFIACAVVLKLKRLIYVTCRFIIYFHGVIKVVVKVYKPQKMALNFVLIFQLDAQDFFKFLSRQFQKKKLKILEGIEILLMRRFHVKPSDWYNVYHTIDNVERKFTNLFSWFSIFYKLVNSWVSIFLVWNAHYSLNACIIQKFFYPF